MEQTHGFYQETYRGFTIMSEHEGTDGEITGYTVAVDSDEASKASGEEIGSMAPGFSTLASARAFIDSETEPAKTGEWQAWPDPQPSEKHGDVWSITCPEYVVGTTHITNPRPREDALLMSAAPRMYEALQDALHELTLWLDYAPDDVDVPRVIARIEKAIAKAEGEC